MNKNITGAGIVVTISLALAFVVGVLLLEVYKTYKKIEVYESNLAAALEQKPQLQKDAIAKNYAMYDAVTGIWRWKTPDEYASTMPACQKIVAAETSDVLPDVLSLPLVDLGTAAAKPNKRK